MTRRGEHMQARQLSALLHLVRRLEDRVLYEIATCPNTLLRDETDRVIVTVARGERSWRLECQK